MLPLPDKRLDELERLRLAEGLQQDPRHRFKEPSFGGQLILGGSRQVGIAHAQFRQQARELSQPFLSGKKLLTTQTFRDLFRSQIIDSSEGLTIKDITFLFADLKGSTELYDRIGDANAYFLVGQHFETLRQAIVANAGSIVKTTGGASCSAP